MTSTKPLVTLTWNARNRQWVARHVAAGVTIEEVGSTSKNARTFMGQKLRERYGKDVEMEVSIDLPAPAKERLAALHRMEAQLHALTDEVPKQRVLVADLLTDEYRLSKGEAADFLNLSQGWLSRQISSAKVSPTPAASRTSSATGKDSAKGKR